MQVLAEHVKGQFRPKIVVASYWIEAFWSPTVLNILEHILDQCPIVKNLIKCIGRLNAQFNPLGAQRHVLCRQGFSTLVC